MWRGARPGALGAEHDRCDRRRQRCADLLSVQQHAGREQRPLSVNGTMVPDQTMTTISAAQLAQTRPWPVRRRLDDLWVQAFDGQTASSWGEFHVRPIARRRYRDVVECAGERRPVAVDRGLVSATDADSDTLSDTCRQHAGCRQGPLRGQRRGSAVSRPWTWSSAAEPAEASFVAGGHCASDDLWAEAFHGLAASKWGEPSTSSRRQSCPRPEPRPHRTWWKTPARRSRRLSMNQRE